MAEFDLNNETIKTMPADMDEFLSYVTEKDGWVFNKQLWRKDGWRSRTTAELYDFYKNDKSTIGTYTAL